MKTNFWKSAAALALGLAALVACDKEPEILPEFPKDVITNDDVTSKSETIEFTANLDWELSVPQTTIGYFWIEGEGGNKLNKISGTAGTHTVTIGVSEDPDLNNDITCDVTLTMGGKSKVIATYTLLKLVKEFNAFPCVITDGALTYKEEGGFLYSEEAATSATLIYNDIYGFVMPFTFESAFNYEIETPDWIVIDSNVGETVGKKGTCAVRVSADITKVTTETTGSIDIYVRNTDEKVASIAVSLPDLSTFILSDKTNVIIGADGLYLGELEACEFEVQTAAELTFVLAGLDDTGWWTASCHNEYTYPNATLNVGAKQGAGLVKSQKVSVSFYANEGAERVAYLLAMPSEVITKVQGGFNTWISNAGEREALSEAFRPYLVTTFTQEAGSTGGGEGGAITVTGAEMAELEAMAWQRDIIAALELGDIPAYQVSASEKFSITSATEIWNYKFFNDEAVETASLFMSEMMSELSIWADAETYGLLVLYTGEENIPFAAIWIEYIPSASAGASFEFVYPEYVSGATLKKATSVPTDFIGVPLDNVYELVYTTKTPLMAMIKVPSMPLWGASWNNADSSPSWWLTYEQMDDTSILVNMNAEAKNTDYFVFGASITSLTHVLICTYDPQ